mgnify:CR=1 FL=1
MFMSDRDAKAVGDDAYGPAVSDGDQSVGGIKRD